MIAIFLSGAISLLVSLVGTRFLIRFFKNLGKGQPILTRDENNAVVAEHSHKHGTPTMGGIAIVGSAVIGYTLTHIRRGVVFSDQALIMLLAVVIMALLGLLDDVAKVRKGRNRGVFWKVKGYITLALSIGVALLLALTTNISRTISFTRHDSPGWHVPLVVWVLWAGFMIFATTNAVNVTDGLDGLAGGSALLGFAAFTIIAYWAFRNPTIYAFAPGVREGVINPLDLAVVAAAFAGACIGFLWWNAAPARIFMGDVGALGIGAALAMLALTTNTHLLLVLICGLNVMEIGSVALQMGYFRATGRKRRLFKMSPIHHHFELSGWPETTVIIRFWIISGLFVALALALFINDFVRLQG
ncbi:MAG: phospho-N-acetylmuramoyl-pentapeptide-transferase [Actinomycetota bacterium]